MNYQNGRTGRRARRRAVHREEHRREPGKLKVMDKHNESFKLIYATGEGLFARNVF